MRKKGKADKPTPTALGDWVKQVREAAGLTQAELQERLGSGEGTVVKWERGERKNIRGDVLKKLLGIAPPDLRATCPVTAGDGFVGVRENQATYGRVSDPAVRLASIRKRLEAALARRADKLTGPQALAVSREINEWLNARPGTENVDESDAIIDILAGIVGPTGRGSRS